MKNLRKYFPALILFISLIIGIFFRFYKMGESPGGLYVDEAALGYNAFSVFKTGRDEYGKFMPVMFRSFSTFQSPIYTYLAVPLISIMGLTPFSVRFPSVFFGILTIPLLYLLVKKISPKKYALKLAITSALFLAISPWHIAYSRTAYETNIALFFLVLGSLFFFHSLKKPWLFVLSGISLAISFNAYRAENLIVPILVLVLALRFHRFIHANLKSFLVPILFACAVGIILIIPVVLIMRTPGFQARTSVLNIFSYSQQNPWGYKGGNGNLPNLINSTQLLSAKEFFSLYTSYFSPRYLFSLGDSGPRKPYPNLGTFFVWQFPLYLIGLYFLLKEKDLKSLKYFIFVLLLSSPIPAALTRDPYSTLRSLPMVIPLTLIISFGLVKILEKTWPVLNRSKYLIVCLLVLYSSVRMFISIFYLNDYFTSSFWNYGWQSVTNSLKDLDPNLPIVVDNSHGDSYILLLFFLNYDPAIYQKDNFEVPLSEYYTNMNRNPKKFLGRITVKNFQWGVDTDHVNQYIIADNLAISEVQISYHHLTIIKEVKHPNGDIALRILKTNPQP